VHLALHAPLRFLSVQASPNSTLFSFYMTLIYSYLLTDWIKLQLQVNKNSLQQVTLSVDILVEFHFQVQQVVGPTSASILIV